MCDCWQRFEHRKWFGGFCRFDFDILKGRQSTRITSAGVVPLLMQIHSSVNVQACRLFGFACSSSENAATCTCRGITLSERKGEPTAHKRQLSSAQFLVEKSGLWDAWGLSVSFICFCIFAVHKAFCSSERTLMIHVDLSCDGIYRQPRSKLGSSGTSQIAGRHWSRWQWKQLST